MRGRQGSERVGDKKKKSWTEVSESKEKTIKEKTKTHKPHSHNMDKMSFTLSGLLGGAVVVIFVVETHCVYVSASESVG